MGICPPKEKSSSHESGKSEKGIMNKDEANETNVFASQAAATEIPLITSLGTALEGSKRKRYMLGSNKETEPTSMSAKKDAEKALAHQAKEEENFERV